MKKLSWVLFSLIILIMNWESQRSVAAIFTENAIPEQSIRLRIIANSDSPQDQILKREIRDHINNYLTTKVGTLDSLDEAREKMKAELPQIQEIVTQTITKNGFTYDSKVELGVVPFPTKMYGQYVYPAGDYEALRVTVGEGLGENWWCVLFPPLCFVDISTGDAVKNEEVIPTSADQTEEEEGQSGPQLPNIQVKFFLFEVFKDIWKSIME